MNGSASFTKGLAEAMALRNEDKFDRALKRVEELQKAWPGNAQLLILWGRLVQLQDDPTHTLNEVKRALQQAIELDKDSPEAAIELGFFLDGVEDDPLGAAKAFAQGIAAARHHLIEDLLGQAKAFIQLDRREDAIRSLVEAHQLADAERHPKKGGLTDRIEELLREMGQMQPA